MVVSKINPQVSYAEYSHIELEDVGYDAPLFEMPILGVDVIVSIGKLKYTHAKGHDIVHVPIYLIDGENDVYKQIGVFETTSERVATDDDGDLDVVRLGLKPMVYSFVNREMLHKSLVSNAVIEKKAAEKSERIDDVPAQPVVENAIGAEEVNAVVDVETEDADSDIEDVLAPGEVAPLPLQTKEQSELERRQYSLGPNDLWIQKYMRNKYFSVVDNEGSGDGFFAAVRDALLNHGKQVTVTELRHKLADEATEEVFQGYRERYVMYQNTLKTQHSELKEMLDRHSELKTRIKNVHDKAQQQLMIAEGRKISAEHAAKKREMEYTKKLAEETEFMKDIKTLEQLKKKLQTSLYWADAWGIATMERVLNIKFIIFSSKAYEEGDVENVLQCGGASSIDAAIRRAGKFEPSSYILLETNCIPNSPAKCGYKLISYKARGIFSFSEVPYDIKLLITSKCLETQAGAFCMIPQFILFQKELGIAVDPALGVEDIVEELPHNRNEEALYNPDIVFQFYSRSMDALPGTGSGEKIPPEEKLHFEKLASYKDWRRMLSNFWQAPFTLDGHTWQSVEHYYQGSKFKNNNREFYLKFSLDSHSNLATDPVIAKAAGGKTGKHDGALVRPKNIAIDPDFFGGRSEKEMEIAMHAKFSQNKELHDMLLATRNAKLVHYSRGSPPTIFNHLMQVRKKLRGAAR